MKARDRARIAARDAAIAARLPLEGLIERLLDDGERARLLGEVRAELALANRLADLLPRCAATPAQLRQLVATLPADGADDLDLEGIVFHPAAPDELLLELLDQRRFVTALGHRAGPRELLERMAERHAYPEAITTLALEHYGPDDQPLEVLLAWVRRHRDCELLDYNLRHSPRLSPARRAAVLAILDEDA